MLVSLSFHPYISFPIHPPQQFSYLLLSSSILHPQTQTTYPSIHPSLTPLPAVSGLGNTLGGTVTGLTDTVSGATKGVGNTVTDTTKGVGDTAKDTTGNKQSAQNPLGLSE